MRAAFLLLALVVVFASARVIQWTAAGGNPLWEFPLNWDSQTVPGPADDVVIDLANIPGNVRISSMLASCNSLKVGGVSMFPQTLYIQNQLTIGSGGAQIFPNGLVTLDGPTSRPLSTAGPFLASNRFSFFSGTLSGPGTFSFTNVNFSGPALHVVNTTVTISGTLVTNSDAGSSIDIPGGQLHVTGTFRSTNALTISSEGMGSLNVPGIFTFQGGATDALTIRGSAMLSNLQIVSGVATLADNVVITTVRVESGATLNTIGALTVHRTIGDISGPGSLNIQGGNNSFATLTNFGSVLISGGIFKVDGRPATIINLKTTSGVITGRTPISITTATLTSLEVIFSPVSITTLNLDGFTNLEGASIFVLNTLIVATPAQLTLSDGAVFSVNRTAVVTQSATLKILPSGGNPPPMLLNEGRWSSSAELDIVVETRGTGTYELGASSTTTINGVHFNSGPVTLTGKFNSLGGTTTVIQSISGSGTVTTEATHFAVIGNVAANLFTHINGLTTIPTATITTLDIQSGLFNITGSGITANTLNFEGGTISATTPSGTLKAGALILSGTQPHTLENIAVTATSLTLSCGPQQCQLFTINATLTAKSTFGSYPLKQVHL